MGKFWVALENSIIHICSVYTNDIILGCILVNNIYKVHINDIGGFVECIYTIYTNDTALSTYLYHVYMHDIYE